MAEIRVEMAARVWKLAVEEGTAVGAGDTIVILESMKMEIPIETPVAGTVRFQVSEGDVVQEQQVLATVETE